MKFWLCLFLAFSALVTTGCNGCREDPTLTAEQKAEEEKKKKEKEKPDFQTKDTVFLPGDSEKAFETNATKMGHWVTGNFRIISNKMDAQGELSAYSIAAGSLPVAIPRTNYYSKTSRPISMPKEEWRNLETNVFIPRRSIPSTMIDFSIDRGVGGLGQQSFAQATKIMDAYQYHTVVLTNRREAYKYFDILDSTKVPNLDDSGLGPSKPFYFVVRTDPKNYPIPLPRQSLNWTTIAYVIWDDLDPTQLDEEQQQAMLDWLHFGGQLILSGPDCLDKLGGSFLADYLPAKFDSALNLTNKEFEAVNRNWSIPISNQPKLKQVIQVSERAPLLGIKFAPHVDANYVNETGEMAIERQIGRGRIVVTAFSMDDKPIIKWPGFNSFVNGCLLRRPSRRFKRAQDMTYYFNWEDDRTSIYDPLLGSTLRYLSRDLVNSQRNVGRKQAGTPSSFNVSLVRPIRNPNFNAMGMGVDMDLVDREVERNLKDHWHYGGFAHENKSGVAGWNDESGVSKAARDTLKEAAGIIPPSSDFVFKMLAVYLVILVPVNWLLFRMIGKVEWAWVAAPLIAIAGAFSVAKLASLDIGFVRSISQVGVVEIYSDYSRAHVSQYSALYTSLSTGYDIDLDNRTAQSLPLAADANANFIAKESIQPVNLRRTVANRLEGLQIQSNSTGLLHTEFMFDLGGRLKLVENESGFQVNNGTTVNLDSVGVIGRTASGQYRYASIGELAAGGQSPELKWTNCRLDELRMPWAEHEHLLSSSRRAKYYWNEVLQVTDPNETNVTVSEIRNITDFAERWSDVLVAAQRIKSDVEASLIEDTKISFEEFERIVEQLSIRGKINVSRIFDAVIDNLQLGPGEVRLLGVTRQSVGNNRIDPESTQKDEQSLVVVHLNQPQLAPAKRDFNSILDLSGESDLDWEKQLEELESDNVNGDDSQDDSEQGDNESNNGADKEQE